MRGLSERGKKEYPKFTMDQIEVPECEVCTAYNTVKKYQIIKKSGRTEEIYLCDNCVKNLVPEGVEVICIEIETPKEKLDSKVEKYDKEGDSLLV